MYEPLPKEGTSLDSAIREMDAVLVERPDLADLISTIKTSLEQVKERYDNGMINAETACAFLFDLYCHYQTAIKETEMAYILRVVGDDFGTQIGVENDRTWELYQQALDKDHY